MERGKHFERVHDDAVLREQNMKKAIRDISEVIVWPSRFFTKSTSALNVQRITVWQ